MDDFDYNVEIGVDEDPELWDESLCLEILAKLIIKAEKSEVLTKEMKDEFI